MAQSDPTVAHPQPSSGKKHFTLEQAHRALPLVRRIVGDVQAVQARRLAIHAELTRGVAQFSPEAARDLQTQLERHTDRLEHLVEELAQIGVELKDPTRGLVDFPSLLAGREMLLCWKMDEPAITHWHEMDAGFSGRKPLADLPAH